jgi:hypothetical protein
MMKEEYKEFVDMLREKIGEGNAAWPVVMKMTHMLEGNDSFEDMMEICEGVQEYKEFLTEGEAKEMASHLENYDKTIYPKWPNPQMLFDAVKSVGGEPEEKGRYNKWALFFLMNMIHSDYGGVLSPLANGTEYAKLCYKMALAWIYDPDRKESIRKKYGLEC